MINVTRTHGEAKRPQITGQRKTEDANEMIEPETSEKNPETPRKTPRITKKHDNAKRT